MNINKLLEMTDEQQDTLIEEHIQQMRADRDDVVAFAAAITRRLNPESIILRNYEAAMIKKQMADLDVELRRIAEEAAKATDGLEQAFANFVSNAVIDFKEMMADPAMIAAMERLGPKK